MRRRTKGQGSLRLRTDGRWEVRLWRDGRRYTRALAVGTTRQEAERVREGLVRARQDGREFGTSRQTLEEYLRSWLETTAARTLRPRSLERYQGVVERHILPHCGQLPLDRLTPQHVAELHAVWVKALATGSVRYNHAVLRSALNQAVAWRLIDRNPAALVRAPRRVRRPMRALSPDDARRFCEGVRGDPLEALYVLALTTGLRLGELLGLMWADIDLEGASPRLTVQRTLVRTGKTWLFGEPKTEGSRRGIVLGALATSALRSHRRAQLRARLAAGGTWAALDLVFADRCGQPLVGAHITERRFKPVLRRLGLQPIRFHDLRHSAATLLLAQGVNPKIVSEMLGHADVQLTLSTYTHVLPNLQALAAAAMDAALADPEPGIALGTRPTDLNA